MTYSEPSKASLAAVRLLSRNCRERRRARGLTLERLSELSSIPLAVLTDIEAGHGNPQLDTILRLAEALGCLPHELFLQVTPRSE
ncbi:MAG: helix-turn-helix transcriptional regulator [Sphingomonadales bacterium]|nr:helix-turn-helix transcriptional regulator [Sphingomonadales bacterium]